MTTETEDLAGVAAGEADGEAAAERVIEELRAWITDDSVHLAEKDRKSILAAVPSNLERAGVAALAGEEWAAEYRRDVEALVASEQYIAKLRGALMYDLVGINTRLRKYLTAGACVWCGWSVSHDPTLARVEASDADSVVRVFEGPSDEELRDARERVTEAVKAHVVECPNHPMRLLEAAARDAIAGLGEGAVARGLSAARCTSLATFVGSTLEHVRRAQTSAAGAQG